MATTPFRGITVTTNGAGVKRFLYRYDVVVAGRKQSRTRTFDSLEAARQCQIETEYQQQRGTYLEPSTRPFGEIVDEFLAIYARKRKASSALKRERSWRLHGAPLLGAIPLRSLTTADIQIAYDLMTSKGLSAEMVRSLHALIAPALNHAIKRRALTTNPAVDAIVPARPRKAPNHYSTAEAIAFLAAVAGDPDEALWVLLLRTGLRIGEALALSWSDLDLEAGRLVVRRTVTLDPDGNECVGATAKTPGSVRLVILDDVTKTALRAHRARQNAQRLSLGSAWQGSGLVFCADDGHFMESLLWRKRLYAMLRAPGTIRVGSGARQPKPGRDPNEPALRRITPHGLRHTTATVALDAGAHPVLVQRLLGHADLATTTNTYMHVVEAMQADLAATIAAKLDGGEPLESVAETSAREAADRARYRAAVDDRREGQR